MTYRLRTHPEVDRDTERIASWLALWNEPASVERRMIRFAAAISRIGEFPFIGATRDDVTEGLRVVPAAERGVVTYLVDRDREEVRILTVTYGGADWITPSRERVADNW